MCEINLTNGDFVSLFVSFGLFVYSFLDIKYTNYIPNVAIFITAGCNLFFPSFIKALKPPEIRRREESEDSPPLQD